MDLSGEDEDDEYDAEGMGREIGAAVGGGVEKKTDSVGGVQPGSNSILVSIPLPPRPRVSNQVSTQGMSRPSSSNSEENANTSTGNATSNQLLSTPVRNSNNNNKGTTRVSYTTPMSTAFEPKGQPPLKENDNSNNNSGNEQHVNTDNGGNNNEAPPKTPLTMMRSVMSNISKDRSEIDGARRPLFMPERDDGSQRVSRHRPPNVLEREGSNGIVENEDREEWDDAQEEEEVAQEADVYDRRDINSPSCLVYGREVIIRFRTSTALTSLSIQPQATNAAGLTTSPLHSRVCLVANEAHGKFGGGNGENRFVIIDDGVHAKRGEDDEESDSPPVCYGDTIALRSNVMDRVLGVQKMEVKSDGDDGTVGSSNNITVKVGCFRRYGRFPPGDRWTILRGGANAPIVQLGSNIGPEETKRVPVYSGDPIVLRNDLTGGLLSLGGDWDLPVGFGGPSLDVAGWSLNLITSSYQLHDGTASTEEDQELIDFLHRHNQCRPRKRETFQIVTANVPDCPDWVYPTGEGTDRSFLDGTYLSNVYRHDLSPELEEGLFPDVVSHVGGDPNVPPQPLATLSVDAQEKILLDEVVGAMMGLEGQFIRFHAGGEYNDSQSDGEDYTIQPGFVFAPVAFTGGNIDSSLESIVSRILPLCSNYVVVNEYVSTCLGSYECGIIARALCEAMGKLLQEYLAFVSKLDYQSREPYVDGRTLTMSMVHVLAQPSIRTMSILYHVVLVVQDKKGGTLLNALQNLKALNYTGDEKGNEILTHLLNTCAVPYSRMLKTWLKAGKLHDPYNEFMIEVTNRTFQSSTTMKQGMEWEDWCRVQDDHVLSSLDTSSEIVAPTLTAFGADRYRSTSNMTAVDKVYTTGRYWRAIHFCQDGSPVLPSEEQGQYSDDANMLLNPVKLSRYIDVSYHKASDSLLHMMLEKYDLLSSLQFMKKYFLLDQGDFFVEFLDAAESELTKGLPTVSRGRVQNSLATSIARTSDLLDDLQSGVDAPQSSQLATALRCSFKKQSLIEELDDLHRKKGASKRNTRNRDLTGFEALQLDFKSIPFPASLVLSHSQIRSYQFIFRQIFFAKYVERQLVTVWSDHQLMKQMVSLSDALKLTFCLRRRMLHFIQNFVYYMKFDVIEPNWRELECKLKAAREHRSNDNTTSSTRQFPRTVDDLLYEHNQFLIRIITQCLLTNSDLIRASTKIMTTCLLFTTQMKLFMGTTKIDEHHKLTAAECSKLRHTGQNKKKNDALKTEFRMQREERLRRCSDRIIGELTTDNFQHMILRFDEVFSANLGEFMKSLKSDYGRRSNAHLTNLFMQLDYNGFVSASMEEKE